VHRSLRGLIPLSEWPSAFPCGSHGPMDLEPHTGVPLSAHMFRGVPPGTRCGSCSRGISYFCSKKRMLFLGMVEWAFPSVFDPPSTDDGGRPIFIIVAFNRWYYAFCRTLVEPKV